MARAHRVVLIVSTLVGSWLGMQAVHEFGHVLGVWLTGGHVVRVVLDPRTISRTDLGHNPQPLLVVWAGPIVGSALPLLCWALVAAARLPGRFVLRFFTGFCMLANGLYIGAGSFDRVGDCGEMLKHGSSLWQLWLFGAVTAPVGLWLWHRQGAHFGLGRDAEPVGPGVAYGTLLACLILLVLGVVIDGV